MLRLAVDVEGPGGRRGGEEVERPLLLAGVVANCNLEIEVMAEAVEAVEKAAAVSEPTSASLCPCFAVRGRCSQIASPGAVVATGRNSPRYSAGAAGFMSHRSTCDEPPQRKKRIVDFALAFPPGSAAAPGSAANPVSPAKPVALARSIARRPCARPSDCRPGKSVPDGILPVNMVPSPGPKPVVPR